MEIADPKNHNTPFFSAIITCYFEEKSIIEFHARLSKALNSLDKSYEIIFVNDGSTDGTFELLKEIFNRDKKVTSVINFFKNSGQGAAITAGINHAKGRHFILMDSDLQLAPEELPLLVNEFEKGCEIVSGYRKDRKDSFFRILPSAFANYIMRKVSKSDLKDFGCTFKIYHGELIRAFNLSPLKLFNPVYVIAQAQECREVPVSHFPRKYGKSGWTFKKLTEYNMENFMGMFSKAFQVIGFWSIVIALLLVLRTIVDYFYSFKILSKIYNGLLLIAIMLSMFITLKMLCLIGEYVVRIFSVAQKNPKYIIKEILER